MSLPLQTDKNRLARCDCREDRQVWDVDSRVLVELPQRWQPGLFFIRKADADSAKFVIKVYDATNNTVAKTFASAQLSGVKVYRQSIWDTVVVPATTNLTNDLPVGVYYLTVAGLVSEPFRVVNYTNGDHIPPIGHLLFELSNAAQLAQVPYETGYKQIFGLPGELCAGEAKNYTEADKSERFGDKITYSRQYRVWTIDYPEVSEPLAGLLKSLELLDRVVITDARKSLTVEGSRIKTTIKADSCCTLSVSLSFEETISEWGTCSTPELSEKTGLSLADIGYTDPADTDPTASPYVPPIAEPPAGVDTTVPIAGTIIEQSEAVTDCGDPFIDINSGLRYKAMTTIARANGSGGVINEFLFSDPCTLDPATVPVPTIPGLLKGVMLRAGQSINHLLIPQGLFGAAPGRLQEPEITVQNLPNGVTYSGGRLGGTPTESGETTAVAVVAQPGGGSINVPFSVSVAPAAPTLLDTNLAVSTAYNAQTRMLTVVIEAPFKPEAKVIGTGWQGVDFIEPYPNDQTDVFRFDFTEVTKSGQLKIRQMGNPNVSISLPVNIVASNQYATTPFDLYLDYNALTHVLTVNLISLTKPEFKLVGTGWAGTDFIGAGTNGEPNSYSYAFPGVLSSGRLYIRNTGESGDGASVPVEICDCEPTCGSDSSLPPLEKAGDPTTADVGTGLTRIITNTTTNKTELVFNRNGVLLCVAFNECGTVVTPQPVMSYSFRAFEHFEFKPKAVPETPQIARIDANVCPRLTGWMYGGKARIERDGVVVAYVDTDISRPDVVAYLAEQGIIASTDKLGFAYYKSTAESSGTHTWRVFVGSSNVEASTDVGAPSTITCETTEQTGNPAPQLINPTGNWKITAFDGTPKVLAANQFADNAGDTGELRALYYYSPFNAYMNLPSWLVFDPVTRTFAQPPAGTPNQTLTIRVVYVDSAGQSIDDEFELEIAVPATQTPTTVGSAAINIVMVNAAECSIILTTPGFAESGAGAFAVADKSRRFIGGNDVDNSLALGSSGYTTTSGVGYFSFGFGINLFRSRYPSATVAAFDVYVHPNSTVDRIVNRLNSSYQVSSGIQKKALSNGFDYEYANPQSAVAEFWGYDAGNGTGQRNTTNNLHTEFTISGGAKKKIGTVTINLSTGVTQFQPITPGS
ncbi:hypothetical protein [Spirosoma sp.]|uniref:hypothetical protein n=1 Tax=Spirosoma sp. TaxID=1899569 RepID=UPI0026320DAA|nr:hypothetical protein [Spirosoma sp.]MCX6218334.1 hypothetical protein [Spirosoma sp.]